MKNNIIKKLLFFLSIILSFFLKISPLKAQETIDTLSFFLADNENIELIDEAGTTPISQRTSGNNKFVIKWRSPQLYEHYTWDNEYIYLKYDYTCCGNNSINADVPDFYEFKEFPGKGGRVFKRQMRVGESITVYNPQGLIWYRPNCNIYSTVDLHYTNTLEAYYPNYNLGPNLGVDEVIVLKTQSHDPGSIFYERAYFAKKWGWVRWQEIKKSDNSILREVIWTRISPQIALFPTTSKCSFSTPPSSCSLSANPNPCNINYQASTCSPNYCCSSTISWVNNTSADITVQQDSRAEQVFAGNQSPPGNSQIASWIKCGSTYTFRCKINGETKGSLTVTANNCQPNLSCPNSQNGNLNCDSQGLIDVDDLTILLNAWSPTVPAPTPALGRASADLNNDNHVDVDDLTRLLNNWRTN